MNSPVLQCYFIIFKNTVQIFLEFLTLYYAGILSFQAKKGCSGLVDLKLRLFKVMFFIILSLYRTRTKYSIAKLAVSFVNDILIEYEL